MTVSADLPLTSINWSQLEGIQNVYVSIDSQNFPKPGGQINGGQIAYNFVNISFNDLSSNDPNMEMMVHLFPVGILIYYIC